MDLLREFYFEEPIVSSEKIEQIKNTDAAFDYFNMLPVIRYDDAPLMLFRLTRYIDPPRKGYYDKSIHPNMYELAPGDIIPNIVYTSTSYTNKLLAEAFNQESQFKGCVFIIKALSSLGMIVINENSDYPNEKEVLLDRRGKLLIKNVSYKYVLEVCGFSKIYTERMIIECEYLPKGISLTGSIDKSLEKIAFFAPIVEHLPAGAGSLSGYNSEITGDTPIEKFGSGGAANYMVNCIRHLEENDLPASDTTVSVTTRNGSVTVHRDLVKLLKNYIPEKNIINFNRNFVSPNTRRNDFTDRSILKSNIIPLGVILNKISIKNMLIIGVSALIILYILYIAFEIYSPSRYTLSRFRKRIEWGF